MHMFQSVYNGVRYNRTETYKKGNSARKGLMNLTIHITL